MNGQIARRRALIGLLLLALATSTRALTVSSPVRFREEARTLSLGNDDFGERVLDVDRNALRRLKAAPASDRVQLENFPIFPGATADLVLARFDVATPDARILVRSGSGTASLQLPKVAHFRGSLAHEPDSRAYVAAHDGFLVAVVQSAAGLIYVGPEGAAEGSPRHVVRTSVSAANRVLAPPEWRCGVEELPAAPDEPASTPSHDSSDGIRTLSATATRSVAVSIETDQELLAKFGGDPGAMSAYITTLIGEISAIYDRDMAVSLVVNRIQAWTTTDPYAATAPRAQLDEVGDWWHANRPFSTYPRAIVHFLSGKPVSGGVAWLGVLCNGDFSQNGHWGGGYGVTQITGAYPSNLWDLLGVAHEIGHNFGSPHTHCYVPAIDQCYGGETGCYSGSTVNPGPRGGTIMSYCHLLPGGYGNIDLRFHERCIAERMLPEVNSSACLTVESPPPPTAASFFTLPPCRVVDTRSPTGPYGGPALAANSDRLFSLGNRCGIPSTAKAVSANLTVTQATTPGVLRLYASGTAVPSASAINYRASQTRANSGLYPLGTGANIVVRCDQTSGNVQAIIDVNGYYQ